MGIWLPLITSRFVVTLVQVQLVGLEEESSEFVCRNTFDHPYPTTKIMWIPDTKGIYPDLLATSGDYLRIWRVGKAQLKTIHYFPLYQTEI